jgi:kynurenine formamidase
MKYYVAIAALALTVAAGAQTREQGPWWPHPRWGPDDQAGASNWITPAKVLEAIKLVKTGKTYELGQVYERGMPLFGQRTYAMFIPGSPTGGPFGENNMLMYHDEFLCAEIGQVGTQFDGLGHIGTRLKMADGTTQDVFYNGVTVDEMAGAYGLQKLGIEHVRPFITRGVLIDLAGYKGVEHLDHSYEVTVADIRGALKKQGIAEESIREGDALLFNYGWSKLWKNVQEYNANPPGIGLEAAGWIVSKKPSMIGSDQWTTEVVPGPDPRQAFPVHQELITKEGIFNLENMVFDEVIADRAYEFLFVFTPIRFKGGTGSPGRPIAIR